ncbi:hypothetical protein DYB32_003811 [Aphanomyces invadans]|uniref:WW domain-containing protein n=1 Tax=Aphanomyces invadans TaxID=157072 RepID=A0A3R6Z5T1_9STRA|nr:hypothetical protein DYB32_003811 [Aphanomyces invadans]
MDKGSPEYKEAVREHARTLGLDPDKEPQYLWIVEEALTAPVPEDWEQGETDDGTIYYFNVNTEESVWEHPMDKYYSDMINTKRAEDKAALDAKKSTAAAFNSAPKSSAKASNSAVVEEFDMDDLDEPRPFKPLPSTKPATTTATTSSSKPAGFGKDSQSWLLDDDDDLHMKYDDAPKASVTVKGAMATSTPPAPTIAPVPATPPFHPRTATTIAPATVVGSSSTLNAAQSEKIEKLEKQVAALTAEVLQLQKDREALEKTERQAKAALTNEIGTLQRAKEQAELEAKESNYLKMKVTELKAKVAALEATKDGDMAPTKAATTAIEAQLAAKTQELNAKCIEFDAKCHELAARDHDLAQLHAKLVQHQADHDRNLKKKDDEYAMKAKEHSIEVEDLKEQLLMRQATNITLQHSTGDLDRLKKKCAEQDDELRVAQTQLHDQTAMIADLEKVTTSHLEIESKKRRAVESDLEAARDQVSALERRMDDHERAMLQHAREKQDLELRCQRVVDDLHRTKELLDEAVDSWYRRELAPDTALCQVGRTKAAEEKERQAIDEKRVAERDLKIVYGNRRMPRDELAMCALRRDKERGSAQTIEVQALKKEIESLNIDLARVRDSKTAVEYDLRNLKQAMSLETSQLMQCKSQIEEFTRKDFMEKQRYELLGNEKSAVEKKVMALEAQLQTMRKEEVGRLKARNIEGENHHIINELRTAAKVLEAQVKELKTQLQDEATAKTQLDKQWAQEMELMKSQLAGQIPQLAAAATQRFVSPTSNTCEQEVACRASDEWKRRCNDMVDKIKAEYEDAWVLEKQRSSQRESTWYDEKREMERQIKTSMSEKDFLNKEISRLEDNNKHLMEQLHTIRVYLTQRPVHSAGPVYNHVPPSVNPEVVGSMHLQNQLGILHAQFQQLFDHTAHAAAPPKHHPRPQSATWNPVLAATRSSNPDESYRAFTQVQAWMAEDPTAAAATFRGLDGVSLFLHHLETVDLESTWQSLLLLTRFIESSAGIAADRLRTQASAVVAVGTLIASSTDDAIALTTHLIDDLDAVSAFLTVLLYASTLEDDVELVACVQSTALLLQLLEHHPDALSQLASFRAADTGDDIGSLLTRLVGKIDTIYRLNRSTGVQVGHHLYLNVLGLVGAVVHAHPECKPQFVKAKLVAVVCNIIQQHCQILPLAPITVFEAVVACVVWFVCTFIYDWRVHLTATESMEVLDRLVPLLTPFLSDPEACEDFTNCHRGIALASSVLRCVLASNVALAPRMRLSALDLFVCAILPPFDVPDTDRHCRIHANVDVVLTTLNTALKVALTAQDSVLSPEDDVGLSGMLLAEAVKCSGLVAHFGQAMPPVQGTNIPKALVQVLGHEHVHSETKWTAMAALIQWVGPSVVATTTTLS